MLLRGTAGIAAAALVALAACGGGDGGRASDEGDEPQAAAPERVEMTITDTAYEAAGTIEAEPVTLVITNETDAPHLTFFARLNEGVTPDDARAAMKKGPDALFPLITIAGGAGMAKPGAAVEVTVDFPEGDYLAIDPEAKGPPPVGFFEVTAASGPEVAAPEADWTIETGDFFFDVQSPAAGPSLVEIANVGEQGHEVIIGRAPAKSEEDEVGFHMAPPPGGRMWVDLDLEPGKYTLLCYFPDPKTGKPHVKLGMKRTFSVE